MSKHLIRISGIKFSSITLFLLGWLGFLGIFGYTFIGIKMYSLFVNLLGKKAWIVPFILLAVSLVGWFSTPQPLVKLKRNKKTISNINKGFDSSISGIQLPKSKLISLRGFDNYFASSESIIEGSATREDLNEIGLNLKSHLNNKEWVKPPSRPIVSINGFKDYFQSYEYETTTEEDKSMTAVDSENKAHPTYIQPEQTNANNSINDSLNNEMVNIQENYVPRQIESLVKINKNFKKESSWNLPDINLLHPSDDINITDNEDFSEALEKVLNDFGIKCNIVKVTHGPVITRYELVPAPGIKVSKIVNLADDIALALAAKDVRIEAPIPGKSAIGIEVPNKESQMVSFHEVIESTDYKENQSLLKIALGKDIAGNPVVADLGKMPHLLVAGATGAGKSVCINTIINSILYNANPQEVKLLLIDPKMVELSSFNGIPHLLTPVVTDSQAASTFLKWAVKEMESRYELFAARGVRDIKAFNNIINNEVSDCNENSLPLIVIIIDELADLMMVAAKEVEDAICRLAQMARAAGIHLIIATQRPSVDVITGIIKANIPSRIAFAVSSQIDSRTILDTSGAEKLLGRGDMLFSPIGLNKPIRVQGCFISDDEAKEVIEYWRNQGEPQYLAPENILSTKNTGNEIHTIEDELYIDAAKLVISSGIASVSFLQRKLKVGYSRAARLIDILEENGIVGGYEGPKPRQVIIEMEEFLQKYQ